MEGFFTFILILVLSVYLLGWLGRVVLRRWILKKQKEMAARFGQQGGAYGAGGFSRGGSNGRGQEGDITVTQTPGAQQHNVPKGVGEYVEFEEFEEQQ